MMRLHHAGQETGCYILGIRRGGVPSAPGLDREGAGDFPGARSS